MKSKKTIITLCVLAAVTIVLAIRWLSFTGTYIAGYAGVEPLGGGSYTLVLRPDGTGHVGQSPESSRPFTYRRTGSQLEIKIDWESRGGDVYLFDIKPLKLISLGHRLPNGRITNESGYGFLMRGTYFKIPI